MACFEAQDKPLPAATMPINLDKPDKQQQWNIYMNDEKATGGINPTTDIRRTTGIAPIKTGSGRKMTRKMHGHEKQMRLRGQLPPAIQPPGTLRIVCISDMHGWAKIDANGKSVIDIPDGDVLVCAGDIFSHGHGREIKAFDLFLATLPHRHKIVIAGNHDPDAGYVWRRWCHTNEVQSVLDVTRQYLRVH